MRFDIIRMIMVLFSFKMVLFIIMYHHLSLFLMKNYNFITYKKFHKNEDLFLSPHILFLYF